MKKRVIVLLIMALAIVFSLSSCDDIFGGEAVDVTVSFDTRGGSEIPDVTVKAGEHIAEPNTPEKEGYEFAGWYTDDSLSFKWKFDVDVVNEDMTLYAGWKKLPAPAHKCDSVCPECGKCLDANCKEAACVNKCKGHAVEPAHECESVCSECGKCLDKACTESDCVDKCEGHVPTHTCESVCPECGKCLDKTCDESVCAEKCEGHAVEPAHECESVCPDCGKCLDKTCDESVCVEKCEGHAVEPAHECESVCSECGKCLDTTCDESACAEKCEGHVVEPPHSCESVCSECGKCLDKTCTESACAEKCEGHVVEPPHTCESVCPECGKCLDKTCTESACAEKCQGHVVAPSHSCESVCSECGKCLDMTCDESACVEKCEGHTAPPEAPVGDIEITLAEAGAETIYFEWKPLDGADGYKVYCDTIPVDNELIRFYGDYYRCDILGITATLHFVRVVPVVGGAEVEESATEFSATPTAHVREGFAFVGNGDANGAYNADGTLKAGAVVLYVTNTNKNTISLTMKTDSKKTETKTGIQNILLGLKKGYYEYPICIRFLGNITDPAVLQGGDLAVDINNGAFTKGITIEGVGNDTVFNGFGLKLKGAKNVEVRNIAFMNCNSSEGDSVSLASDNYHVWVHNCDFFYGDAGSDADQAKGDGALDTKVSQYVTYSYNHFWDCGKVHLNGNGDETVNYITYHHNWYDHCDSRMPRVRVSDSIHVYNNFFDGISKYCVGATTGCSIFVENNYFLNSNRPMSISMQGKDDGTFSSEAGGMIKAYGNVMINCTDLTTYSENKTSFDYYDASSRDERVPSSVVALKGGSAYSNFDTDSDMYSYSVQSPEAAMESVKLLAGRVQGGDIKWTFTNKDNSDYDVNAGLKSVLKNYKSSLVSVGGVEGMDTEIPEGGNNGVDIPEITNGIVHNFTTSGTTSDFFQIEGNLSTSKGTVTYDGLKLTKCLKMESSTKITFTLSKPGTIILVIGGSGSNNEWRVDVDGVDHQNIIPEGAENYMLCIVELEAGTHTITKKDQTNLYYIVIEQAEDADLAAE